jgi:hypothetical protein
MKLKIRIPNTRFVVVLWYRDNKANRTTIERPANMDALQLRMLKERVGVNEIRALFPVTGDDLVRSMQRI